MGTYLTEVGDVKWRPIVPESMKPAMLQVGTETHKPESPLTRTVTAAKPAAPVKK